MPSVNTKIINETNFRLPQKLVKDCVEETLGSVDAEISIVFVEPEKIRELNKRYRGQDKVTDVLSFPMPKATALGAKTARTDNHLGDIIVCPQYIKENSEEFEWEVCHVVVHGTLHLLGKHHDEESDREKIHKLEQKIIKKVLTH